MTMTRPRSAVDPTTILTDDMLARFDERAATYDRENRFFDEDFAELRDSGYLLAALPAERGGAGLDLAAVGRLQQRLAYVAPATAVAVNMHHYWTGVAADLCRFGDDRMPRGCSTRSPTATSSRPGMARSATTPACSPRTQWPSASMAGGPARSQGLRQPVARVDLPRLPRDGPHRPHCTSQSCTASSPATRRLPVERDLGHARHARDRAPRHASSTAPSCPTGTCP